MEEKFDVLNELGEFTGEVAEPAVQKIFKWKRIPEKYRKKDTSEDMNKKKGYLSLIGILAVLVVGIYVCIFGRCK